MGLNLNSVQKNVCVLILVVNLTKEKNDIILSLVLLGSYKHRTVDKNIMGKLPH